MVLVGAYPARGYLPNSQSTPPCFIGCCRLLSLLANTYVAPLAKTYLFHVVDVILEQGYCLASSR
jgi:hypothetical protein